MTATAQSLGGEKWKNKIAKFFILYVKWNNVT